TKDHRCGHCGRMRHRLTRPIYANFRQVARVSMAQMLLKRPAMLAYHRNCSLIWLTLSLGLTAACTSEEKAPQGDPVSGSGDQLASYGEETIGYKLQKTDAERAQEANAASSGQGDSTGAGSPIAFDGDGTDDGAADD